MLLRSTAPHNIGFNLKSSSITVVAESTLELKDEVWKKFRDLPSVKVAFDNGSLVMVRDVILSEAESDEIQAAKLAEARAIVEAAKAEDGKSGEGEGSEDGKSGSVLDEF